MTDTEVLKLAKQELNHLIMVMKAQELSDADILRLLLDAYRTLGGALPNYCEKFKGN